MHCQDFIQTRMGRTGKRHDNPKQSGRFLILSPAEGVDGIRRRLVMNVIQQLLVLCTGPLELTKVYWKLRAVRARSYVFWGKTSS